MHQLPNWGVIEGMGALLLPTLRFPPVNVQGNTFRYIAEIELEGKINPHENLISLDCAELFVLQIVNSSAHNAGRLLCLFI